MLEELTQFNSFGSIHHLRVVAASLASAPCAFDDLFIIANSESAAEIPRIEESVALLERLGFCEIEGNRVKGLKKLSSYADNPQIVVTLVAQELLKTMLSEGVIPIDTVKYCSENGYTYINQHDISTRYSQMRNLLIEAEFFKVDGERLIFAPRIEPILENAKARLIGGLSPEQLLEKLERDKETGAAAEVFVMEYERKRIGYPLANRIQQVSLLSVSAGYDIVSFETAQSVKPDRFIEVKAIGKNGFFLSGNELNTARKLGHQYCIYLVDMKKTTQEGYTPEIIRDPSAVFSNTSDWRIVPDSYHITKME